MGGDRLGVTAGGEVALRRMVALEAEAELLDVVGALRPPGRLAGRLHRREEEADEGADDGDDDEKLDEGEGPRGPGVGEVRHGMTCGKE